MRNVLILIAISVCLLSVGCSGTESTDYLTPVTEATLSAYGKIGSSPVKNKLDAVIVARISMQGLRKGSVGDPVAVYVEKISISEASQKIGWNPAHSGQPENMMVWLVIFEGEWMWIFPMPDEQGIIPTSEPPSHGCMFSLLDANDGGEIAAGDIKCPSEIK